jgi:hypothetical protein
MYEYGVGFQRGDFRLKGKRRSLGDGGLKYKGPGYLKKFNRERREGRKEETQSRKHKESHSRLCVLAVKSISTSTTCGAISNSNLPDSNDSLKIQRSINKLTLVNYVTPTTLE